MGRLIDSHQRIHTYLRVSLTDRCNLRCVYCMPSPGTEPAGCDENMSSAEITRLARIFAGLGVNKVRLTGGEPLLRRDLEKLVERLAGMSGLDTLGLTTNGVLLAEQALALRRAGINRLNLSLDSLRPERFAGITTRDYFNRVLSGLDAALEAGFSPVRLNVVIVKGVNDDELVDFVEFVRDKPVHVRFIEYMPFRANRWNPSGFLSFDRMRRRIESRYSLIPCDSGENQSGTARQYRIEGFLGEVGFITSLSDKFCARCNRLRLTADGRLKTCLFYPAEVSLAAPLRDGAGDDEIAGIITRALAVKPKAHPPLKELINSTERSMIEIGG
ncbi:GTP 3',8-cyclase MoaA [Gemmatimonadota bacterium]